jgi:hypothetical protein
MVIIGVDVNDQEDYLTRCGMVEPEVSDINNEDLVTGINTGWIDGAIDYTNINLTGITATSIIMDDVVDWHVPIIFPSNPLIHDTISFEWDGDEWVEVMMDE